MVNELLVKIKEIKKQGNLHIVKFDFLGDEISMMSLELPNVEIGLKVKIGVKPLNIALSKNDSCFMSFANKLPTKIIEIKEGELLCSVNLLYKNEELQSVITKESCIKMGLKNGDEVVALIQANEIFIKELYDEGH